MISTSVWWRTSLPCHWIIICSYSGLYNSNQLVYMCDSHELWLHTWCESLQWSHGKPDWLQTITSINRADVNMGLSALMCHKSCPRLSSLSRHANKSSASAQKEQSGPNLKPQYPRSRWGKSVINFSISSGGDAAPRRRSSSTSLVCYVTRTHARCQAPTWFAPPGVIMFLLWHRPLYVLFVHKWYVSV